MPTLFLLFSHILRDEQVEDARCAFGIQEVVCLPEDLQTRWSNVPPELASIEAYIQPVLNWVGEHAQSGDYVLAQGDYGLTFLTVAFALQHKLIPVYATTTRDVIETRLPDGTVQVQRIFRHVRFRKYQIAQYCI